LIVALESTKPMEKELKVKDKLLFEGSIFNTILKNYLVLPRGCIK